MSETRCLIYYRGLPRRALVRESSGARWRVELDDGTVVRFPANQVLYQWKSAPDSAAGDSAPVPDEAALEQLHGALPPGQAVDFERIAGEAMGPEATGEARAGLFEALLGCSRLFRHAGGAFTPRTAEQIADREKSQREREDRKAWAAAAIRLRDVLERGEWPPTGEAHQIGAQEAARFLDQLESVLALERGSPYWEMFATALEFSAGSPDVWRPMAKRWLMIAGAWRDWPSVWLRRAEVTETFSEAVLSAAEGVAGQPVSLRERADFRASETYTVDTRGALDLDDAVSVLEAGADAVTVAVHIADPAVGLLPGKPLFDEAARRISSVYTPNRVYPMLPPALSDGRFSLHAGQDRETITFVLRITGEGEAALQKVERGVVRVLANLDYEGGDQLLLEHPGTFGRLASVCQASRERRTRAGAGVNESRPEVRLTEEAGHVRLERYDRSGPAQRMIEELAVLTNREAGRYCRDNGLPALYRGQAYQPPAGERKEFAQRPPANFSTQPEPHAGLACDAYIQVTSPIRRFPDLVMLRQIVTHAAGEGVAFPDMEQMDGWGRTAEQRMLLIAETERRITAHWKRRHLTTRLGETLSGTVRRVGRAGWGRVWLESVLLMVDARMPDQVRTGDRVSARVLDVEPDRERVVVEVE